SAEARHDVFAADPVGKTLCHAAKDGIAYIMAAFVVDVLELVEIDEQHGGNGADAFLDQHGFLHALLQQAAIGQFGQRVVVGEAFDRGAGAPQFGDVGGNAA